MADGKGTQMNTSKLIVYGAAWCPDVTLARRYLDRHGVAYVYRDIDAEPAAMQSLLDLRGEAWVIPTIVLPNGTILDNPSIRELAERLGRPNRKAHHRL